MADLNLYTVGGTVQAGGGIYIPRQADEALLQLCRDRLFAYVLTPRQMGKSSLMVRTAERLREEGVRTAIADLQDLGAQVSVEQWYLGFLVKLDDQLEFDTDVVGWWQGRSHLGVAQRLTMFFEQVLLAEIGSPAVIFVDEIDSTLSLDFTDDFFIAVRSLYVARATQPLFKRLSFVLVGVATPGDLIADAKRTPFNIGHPVEIEGFSLAEALPLAQGLTAISEQPEQVLAAVLHWTGGQPFLTQKLCQILQSAPAHLPAVAPATYVEEMVRSRLIDNWEAQDNPAHLKTIRDRLLRQDWRSEQQRGRLLGVWQQVLEQGEVAADDGVEQTDLRLSGLMTKRQNRLQMFNPIYGAVFDGDWVAAELAKLRPYGAALQAWLASGRTDESRLLRGNALAEVLGWAQEKRLDDVDRQFFEASQAIERREVEEQLAAERQVTQTLLDANEKAKWRIRVGSGVLAGTLVLSAIAAVYANQAQTGANRAEQVRAEAEAKSKEAEQRSQAAIAQLDVARKATEASKLAEKQAKERLKKTEAREKAAQAKERQARTNLEKATQQVQVAAQRLQAAEVQTRNAQTATAAANQEKLRAQEGLQTAEVARAQARRERDLASQEKAEAVLVTQLERGSVFAMGQVSYQPIAALLTALRTGKALQDVVQQKLISKLADYPTTSPMLALHTALSGIRVQNSFQDKEAGMTGEMKISPKGDRILTIMNNNTVRVWNLQGQQLASLQGHQSNVWSAAFSPDGQRIVTASSDNTAKLWNLEGKELASLQGHQSSVWSAAFSPDGQRIVTASDDNTAKLWAVESLNQLMVRGCRWLQGYLENNPTVQESDRALCREVLSRR